MSAIIIAVIHCDGEKCETILDGHSTATEGRRAAADSGWHCRGAKDYCPSCSAVMFKPKPPLEPSLNGRGHHKTRRPK